MKTKTLFSACCFFVMSAMLTKAQIINTIAGNGYGATSSGGFSGDGGQATLAELYSPCAVAVDASGNIYIGDYYNNRIRKINTSGIISTFAGNGYGAPTSGGFSGDGGQATAAELYYPIGIYFDSYGNVYISDELNNRIRKVNSSGIITTIVGNGSKSYFGDGGQATAAELNWPCGVALDGAGNIYVSDFVNNRIRQVNTSGVISTFAGNGYGAPGYGGYSGDGGQATAAEINYPHGIMVDGSGNVYFGDTPNNRVRKVNTAGIISTFAGNGYGAPSSGGYSGDGGQASSAELYEPTYVSIDSFGNIQIADGGNNRIRVVSTSGIINTAAGNGIAGFFGDGGPATASEINAAGGVGVDVSGNIYVTDTRNDRIRKISSTEEGINVLSANNQISIYPNPAIDKLYIQLNGLSGKVNLTMYNIMGQEVFTQTSSNQQTVSLNVSGFTTGLYLLKVQGEDGSSIIRKIEISK